MPETNVDVTIDGRLLTFLRWPSGVEYDITSSQIESIHIWSCMSALRKFSEAHPPNNDGESDSYLTVVLENKLPWEGNLFGAYIDLVGDTCEAEFSLNTAVGAHESAVASLVSAATVNSGFRLVSVRHGDDRPVIVEDGWHTWSIRISCDLPEAKFADLFVFRRRMSQAVFLPSDLITTPHLAFRMVQLGQADALLGHEESEWLEVKSSPYDLKKDSGKAWKIELAKDIAQFANSDIGGLLVIGLHTRRINGADTIDKVTAFPISPSRVQSYRDIVKERIHPPIGGLELGAVEFQGLHIIYAFVPPQREENKPYLVAGAVINDTYDSQGITIVRRQGDASIPIGAREIHSALAAGRALWQRAAGRLDQFPEGK